VCREGLVRLCSERYAIPTKENLRDTYAHLTNYSLNKRNGSYVHTPAAPADSAANAGSRRLQAEGKEAAEAAPEDPSGDPSRDPSGDLSGDLSGDPAGGSKRKLSDVLPELAATGAITEEVRSLGSWL